VMQRSSRYAAAGRKAWRYASHVYAVERLLRARCAKQASLAIRCFQPRECMICYLGDSNTPQTALQAMKKISQCRRKKEQAARRRGLPDRDER